jgi:hypothetical protein
MQYECLGCSNTFTSDGSNAEYNTVFCSLECEASLFYHCNTEHPQDFHSSTDTH